LLGLILISIGGGIDVGSQKSHHKKKKLKAKSQEN